MNHKNARHASVALNEGEVIARAQEGDADAFESLYKAHCKHVYSVCLRMLKNAAEAEDLTQQVFLQLFRKIGTFRGDSGFSTWLHRISVNAVLMYLRRKQPPGNLVESLDDRGRSDTDPIEQTVAVTAAVPVIDRLNLKRAIGKLPTGYRRFFLLHDVFGYQHDEIAELLGCSVGCSKSQLHKARKSLRRLLRGEDVAAKTSPTRPGPQHNERLINMATARANSWEKAALDYFKAVPICMTRS